MAAKAWQQEHETADDIASNPLSEAGGGGVMLVLSSLAPFKLVWSPSPGNGAGLIHGDSPWTHPKICFCEDSKSRGLNNQTSPES